MKISVAWLFDHLDADPLKQDIANLYAVFNQKTAEMEKIHRSSFDFKNCAAAVVIATDTQQVTVSIPEWNLTAILPARSDAQINSVFLVYKTPELVWAAPIHFHSESGGLLPRFNLTQAEIEGAWKQVAEAEDTILEIDNKSLTHRPDLWGHYGFAREIAAILDIPFKPLQNNIASLVTTGKNPFTVENLAPQACKRFIGTYFESFKDRGSNICMAFRLLRVGMRPINGIVDVTNYMMLDTSQPSHAYDADRIQDKKIIVRMAKKNEALTLLDGSDLALSTEDLVIADTQKALGLAGIKGGLHDSINEKTKAVFFVAEHFDAAIIRKSAARHKTRTDGSARHEKTIDPNQLELATLRFIELANQFGISLTMIGAPIIIGNQNQEKEITVTHEYLVSRSGVALTYNEVIQPLQKLGFKVTHQPKDHSYHIIIPTFRGTKDIQQPEDILEEVIRMYGFGSIIPMMPAVIKQPSNLTPLMRMRAIKKYLSSGAQMLEQQNYAFFDEDFMIKLDWQTPELIELKHPVSQQYKRMVTTLIPNLLKNVYENFVDGDSLAFFECGKTWNPLSFKEHGETKKVAGIFFEKKKTVDFYEHKQKLENMLNLCDIKEIIWKKVDTATTQNNPWMQPFQVAELFVGTTSIGYAGKANKKLMVSFDCLPESDAFIFELNAEFLYSYKAPVTKLKPMSRYQGSTFDLSMIIPLTLESAKLQAVLQDADPYIEKVALIDFFEKEEWTDKRSVAFRLWVQNPTATMTKEEIEAINKRAVNAVQKEGAVVRA